MERVIYKLKRNTGGVWWSFTLRRAYAHKRQDIDIVEVWLVDVKPANVTRKKSPKLKLIMDDLWVYLITPKRLLYTIGGCPHVGDF